MSLPEKFPGLTPDLLAKLQAAIDDDSIWMAPGGGGFAMFLIREGACRMAPGVLTMWLGPDDTYRPIRSNDELHQLVEETLQSLSESMAASKAARAEVEFLTKHHDELARLHAERNLKLAILPWTKRRYDAEHLSKVNVLRAREGLPPQLPGSTKA